MTTFLSDTFTDTDGTLLSAHTPDVGGTWEQLDTRLQTTGTDTDTASIQSNTLKSSAASGTRGYRNAAAPASAEYDITATFTITAGGASSSLNDIFALGGRVSPTGVVNSLVDRYVTHVRAPGSIHLDKIVGGAITALASLTGQTIVGTVAAKFEIRDATKKVYLDGVEKLSSADNAITQVGRVGVAVASNVRGSIDSLTAATVSSGTTVNGNQATETDTAQAGAPALTLPGALAPETDAAQAGTPTVRPDGALGLEADAAQAGAPVVALAGGQPTETDTPHGGAPAVTVPGLLAISTETALPGSPVLTLPTGSQATETDAPHAGAPSVAVAGALAGETDLPQAGTPTATLTGQQATQTETALPGSIRISIAGNRADEILTAQPGTPAVALLGQLATEVDEALAGVAFQRQDTPTPAERMYIIQAERRRVTVATEDRRVVVPAESRRMEVSR